MRKESIYSECCWRGLQYGLFAECLVLLSRGACMHIKLIALKVLSNALGFSLSKMCSDVSALLTNRRLKFKTSNFT